MSSSDTQDNTRPNTLPSRTFGIMYSDNATDNITDNVTDNPVAPSSSDSTAPDVVEGQLTRSYTPTPQTSPPPGTKYNQEIELNVRPPGSSPNYTNDLSLNYSAREDLTTTRASDSDCTDTDAVDIHSMTYMNCVAETVNNTTPTKRFTFTKYNDNYVWGGLATTGLAVACGVALWLRRK